MGTTTEICYENLNLVEIIQKKILGILHKDLGVLHIFGEMHSVKMSKTHCCVSMVVPSGFIVILTMTYNRKECTVGHATVLHYAYISFLVFKIMWSM
jgi:hypothetical protein